MHPKGLCMLILIFLLLLLNLGISYWNARVCGQFWLESEQVGGRFLLWCGAIMSAIGFSSVYLPLMLLLVVSTVGDPGQGAQLVKFAMSFWYLLVIVPILGTGLVITVHSWVEAYQRRDGFSMGVAAYNTFAQAHNTWDAVQNSGDAFKTVTEGLGALFGGGDSDDAKGKVVLLGIVMVVCALLAGVLTTVVVMRRHMGTLPLPSRTKATRYA